jgi:hypothetical protein
MGKTRRAFRLMATSFRVLRATPALLAVMAVGVVGSAAVTITLGYLVLGGLPTAHDLAWPRVLLVFPLLASGSYVSNFCNAVVMATAHDRMAGREATVGEGFRRALARLPELFWWTTLAIGVGVVLQVIAERLKLGGVIARWVLGLAWAFATFFVVPAIVIDGTSLGDGIRRSASLVKARWGEAVTGFVGFGAIALVGFFLGGVAVVMAAMVSGALAIVVGVAAFCAIMAATEAASSVFRVALYAYAKGEPVGPFSEADLWGAFRLKGQRR